MPAAYLAAVAFPRAADYRLLAARAGGVLRERADGPDAPFTERHLKCIWFDPAWRPPHLRTHRGEEVAVEDPGRWNLEAGPDFIGAVLRAGPDRRRLAGDVEVHIRPSDWREHAHARNPAYARVRAHVCWFPGALPESSLPSGALQIALRDALAADPCFAFESVDLAAYPFAARTAETPCARRLAGWPPDRQAALLEAAGEERLRRKAARLAAANSDPDQALYAELMASLGYKRNCGPFREIARRLPLAALREAARGGAAYALLLGVAGLLPPQMDARWDAETRAWVRNLWKQWWQQPAWHDRALTPAAWRLGGVRPQNHPRRRLAAAAAWSAGSFPPAWLLGRPAAAVRQALAWLQPETRGYWRRRLALGGPLQPRPVSLNGRDRAAAMLANVIVPFLAARISGAALPGELLRALPAAENNSLIRQTARWLLGPDHNPALYRQGLRQQGLIQICQDFCLDDRSRCATCRLPAMLDAFSA